MSSVIVKELDISEFRGIRRLAKPLELGSFNVLVGRNNVGKTAILEALYLLSMPYSYSQPPYNRRIIDFIASVHGGTSLLVYGYAGTAVLRHGLKEGISMYFTGAHGGIAKEMHVGDIRIEVTRGSVRRVLFNGEKARDSDFKVFNEFTDRIHEYDVVVKARSNLVAPVDISYIHFPVISEFIPRLLERRSPIRKFYNKLVIFYVKCMKAAASRVLTNSMWTARQIYRAYRVIADVGYSPVNVKYFSRVFSNDRCSNIVVTILRFTAEKDLERIVDVAARLRNYQFYICGFTDSFFDKVTEAIKRRIADKGLVEALIVFKHIAEHNLSLKLVVTRGDIGCKLRHRKRGFLKRLKIEDRALLLGFLPRDRRLRLIAEDKLMLYPSHIDAFPYAVLEPFALETPIVAYNIPALRLYYNGVDGVELVEEGNIAEPMVRAVEMLKRRDSVEPQLPRLPTWDEIMEKELEFWYKCAELPQRR